MVKDPVARSMTEQFRSMLDEPLDCLNKKTPRECIGLPEYRQALASWVSHLERTTRRADGKAYGFAWLRYELKLRSSVSVV